MTISEFLAFAPEEFLRPFIDDNGDLTVDYETLNMILSECELLAAEQLPTAPPYIKREFVVYTALVKLFLRAGQLDMAQTLIQLTQARLESFKQFRQTGVGLVTDSDDQIFTDEERAKW